MKTIGFIGCGNMSQPIIKAVMRAKLYDETLVYDADREKLEAFCRGTGARPAVNESDVALTSDTVMLCVKPQVLPAVLETIRPTINRDALVVSIAAGKTTDWISERLGSRPVARIMPNLNATVGEAISAYTGGAGMPDDRVEAVGDICRTFGEAVRLDEALFGPFSVCGGCAPAYTFMFIGALADAAKANGLDPDTAFAAAVQCVLGSAKLLRELGGDVGEWVRRVCSPGGTTIEGVRRLESGGLTELVRTAFDASLARDRELSGS